MPKMIIATRRLLAGSAALLLVATYPLPAFADDGSTSGTTPSSNTQTTGPTKPNGRNASSYVYNPLTGMWENDKYIWNPTTQQYSLKPVIVVPPPAPDPSPSPSPDNSSGGGSGSGGTSTNPDNSLTLDNSSNSGIGNTIGQDATSGNAGVVKNTTGGSALTGNASDATNLINMICNGSQTCAPSLQSGVSTFTTDVYGNVQGDLMIDPSQLSNLTSVNSGGTQPSNVTINTSNGNNITNNIDLNAASGDATVAKNTSGGSATTGDASTMANIVNVINSAIGAGQSFLGTVNIYGNLDGDILMPPDLLSNLITSNASPTLSTANSTDSSKLLANLTNNSTINNNLNLSAASGSADVTGNTSAGNATSGNAATNITLLNLTGQQVIGKDALLVFVNVSGKWVGMIVNAPGATSAALCDTTCTASSMPTNANINATNNSTITNNLNESATSGNALVNKNTSAGNATSGNAFAGANIVNISTSQLALQNWLGILFINVFGSWNGSFGVNTAAGNAPTSSSPTIAEAVKQVKVFSFVPKDTAGNFSVAPIASVNSPSSASDTHKKPVVLSASTNKGSGPSVPANHKTSLVFTAGSLFFLAGALSAGDAYAKRKENRAKFRAYLRSVTVQPLKKP